MIFCKSEIEWIENKYHIVVDQFVIMPNHIHFILILTDDRQGTMGENSRTGTGENKAGGAEPLPYAPTVSDQ